MDTYTKLVNLIIEEQEAIIGPIAFEQAQKVEGIEVVDHNNIKIVGNAKDVLTKLVNQYAKLFGRASIEVCKEAVRELSPQPTLDQLPEILR